VSCTRRDLCSVCVAFPPAVSACFPLSLRAPPGVFCGSPAWPPRDPTDSLLPLPSRLSSGIGLATMATNVHAQLLTHFFVTGIEEHVASLTLSQPQSAKSYQTPSNQGASSSLIKPDARLKAFGYLPMCARFDPTHGCRVHKLLVPVDGESTDLPPFPVCGENVQLVGWGENQNVGPVMKDFFATTTDMQAEHTLQKGLGIGRGAMDKVWVIGNAAYAGDAEGKGGESSLAAAFRQAAIYTSSMAMERFVAGVAAADVVIPIIAYNGTSIQFGATILLPPCFPVAMVVSQMLDIGDLEGNRLARAFYRRAADAASRMKKCALLPVKPPRISPMELCTEGHYFKILDCAALGRGLGLFCPSRSYEDQIATGIAHMMQTLNVLFYSPARKFVVFPLSIRSPQEGETLHSSFGSCPERSYWLVYRDITFDGFLMGTPPRSDDVVFDRYIHALAGAVTEVHKAGVVHLDLYPSNIFWKSDEGVVEVRLIDWDVAHQISERELPQGIESANRAGHSRKSSHLSFAHDLSMLEVLSSTSRDSPFWASLNGVSKSDMDDAFFSMLSPPADSAAIVAHAQ
jgi:serine/threonine protein kinase